MKLSDFNRESIDIELRNQSIKSDSHTYENDLYIETAKNNSNSGEFVGGGDFFVSFSDVMSVLLCFFVVFFSISDQSQESFDEFFATWPYSNDNKEIKRPNNASLSDQELLLMGRVKELVKSGVSPEALTRNDTKTIALIVSNADLFVPGKIKISSNGSNILKDKLKIILSKGGIRQIRIEGHTDDEDFIIHQKLINKYSNNLAFSIGRASAVSQILNKSLKFPEKMTIITGFGAKQPTKLNPLNLDKSINSRIEIKILQDKNVNNNIN
jgi:chemotaxis protein MotB